MGLWVWVLSDLGPCAGGGALRHAGREGAACSKTANALSANVANVYVTSSEHKQHEEEELMNTNEGFGQCGNGAMGQWGNGAMGQWANGAMGQWGNGQRDCQGTCTSPIS